MARWLLAIVSARTWKATAYLLLTLVTGTFWFTVIVSGVSLGFGLLVVWIGVPLLLLTFLAARYGARAERRLVRWAFGVEIPELYRSLPEARLLRRLWTSTSDPATWKDCIYLLLLFPLGIAWFTLVVVLWSVAGALIALPIYYRFLPHGHAQLFHAHGHDWVVVNTWWKAIVALIAGLGVALLIPPILRAAGWIHGGIAKGLLGPSRRQRLRAEMLRLAASREKAVWSAEAERRRIERDLHDGTQARLVALAIDLGRAREKLDTEPEEARALFEHAHEEAKATIADLRSLARGIHPAVLTDRGLDAALSALAARSPVPVRIDVRVDERPAPVVESIAYFVVSEALTNVAKHAGAHEAEVSVVRSGGSMIVEVRDDGAGGAAVIEDGGLAGLADRVASVDGSLTVSSPAGGGTVVRAELPCAS